MFCEFCIWHTQIWITHLCFQWRALIAQNNGISDYYIGVMLHSALILMRVYIQFFLSAWNEPHRKKLPVNQLILWNCRIDCSKKWSKTAFPVKDVHSSPSIPAWFSFLETGGGFSGIVMWLGLQTTTTHSSLRRGGAGLHPMLEVPAAGGICRDCWWCGICCLHGLWLLKSLTNMVIAYLADMWGATFSVCSLRVSQ